MVAALRLIRVADQGTVVIHLFAGVVLMHIDTITVDIIGRVLDRIQSAGFGVLGNSD